jgi:TetR/AcrR family transcriptional repressor of bet genes
MGPIRREQIHRAAAEVIAARGLDRTTIREVAQVAGVSTGTVNHYFKNRLDMLLQTLVYVSEKFQTSWAGVLAAAQPGMDRFSKFCELSVSLEPEDEAGWKVWIAAWGEATRSGEVRELVAVRRRLFQQMIAGVLSDLPGLESRTNEEIAELSSEVDAYVNGWGLWQITGETRLDPARLKDALLSVVGIRSGERSIHSYSRHPGDA